MNSGSANPARIACISDTHLFPKQMESEALFPYWMDALGPVKGPRFYKEVTKEVRLSYDTALTYMRRQKPEKNLHFGDVTGGWRERGLIHRSVVEIARRTYQEMSEIAPTFICAGNHDTGYPHPKIPGSEISEKALICCENVFKNLWWETRLDSLKLLGVCSPLFQYHGNKEAILRRKNEQSDFLGDMLQTYRGDPWALCTHDILLPMKDLGPILHPHLSTCESVLHGDLHNSGPISQLRKAAKYLSSMTPTKNGRVARTLLSKSSLCPSTAPLWWKGYQMLTADWDGQRLNTDVIQLERPPESRNVATRSALQCLFGMIRGKTKSRDV